jgi:hypothetical protein
MKHCHHSVPLTRFSNPDRHARAWLSVLCVVGNFTLQAAPVPITGAGSYSQDFDMLPASGSTTWTDDSTLPGWYSQRSGGSGTSIEANAGTSPTGALYSYGTASTTERALGSIGADSAAAGNFAHGVQLQNTSGEAATVNSLAYTGEQWRKSGVVDAQVVTLWYKISPTPITSLEPSADAGWTAAPAGNFSSPVNTSAGTSLDGNAPVNRTAISINPNLFVPAGNYLMIRWKDPDHAGTDHGLAIDDVSLGWIASPVISLSPGAIAFVGFNADGNDDLAFVALTAIAANDVIRFTDNEWNGSPLVSGGAFVNFNEGIINWTAPVGGITAGTVVRLSNLATLTPVASAGNLTRSGDFDIGAENEMIYAYQGTAQIPTGFLAVIATHSVDSTIGTGLNASHVIYLPNDRDVAAYNGSRSSEASFPAYLTLLGVAANWVTEDGLGDQSANGIAPDVPFAATVFTVTSVGNTFANWLAIHAPGESASQDHDGDSLPNAVEYFMGSATNAFTAHPGVIDGAVSWPRAAGTTITEFKVEVSSDMISWENANVSYAANLSIDASQVVFTLPNGLLKLFVRLNVVP